MSTKKSSGGGAGTKPEGDLGQSLKDIRKQRGMTLNAASELTGLPVSTLSKIENNKMSLSYDKLLRICTALDVDISELFSGSSTTPKASAPAPSGRRSINRRGTGYAINTPSYSHLYPAADLLNKRAVPIIAEIHARSLDDFGELIRHPGEEFAYVLEGVVDIYTDLYAPVRLEAGDSIYFDSGMGHAYIAVSADTCRVLSVCSSEGEHMDTHFADKVESSAPAPAPAQAPALAAPSAARKRGKAAKR
jgi:transcriptional regulator with XRE-family HTH domain